MRDGIAAAGRGVPAVVLVTENFRQSAAFVSRAEGLPDIPVVVTPHPIAGTGAEYMAKVATELAQEIKDKLCSAR